jgi:hypothetical protein
MKVYENGTSGNRVVLCRQTDRQTDWEASRQTDGQTDGQTEITKLIIDCRNFANDPLNYGETGEPG